MKIIAVAILLSLPSAALAQVSPAVPSVSVGGTITAANVYQSILPASTGRRGCVVQNKSANVMRLYLGAPGSATDAAAMNIAAGGTFNCRAPGGLIIGDELSITGTTNGDAFVVARQ